MKWEDDKPIYLQLKEKVIAGVLEGVFKEGEVIPSIRQVSEEYRLNHLTVAKAYQALVDEHVLEKRRGLGMFVKKGAEKALKAREKKQFLQVEWPKIKQRIKQLDFNLKELLDE
jgi:GntR family transcriptional regulator